MKKRVRSEKEKSQTIKRIKEMARRRSAAATDKGKNSTRVCILHEETIDYLWRKGGDIVKRTHGVPSHLGDEFTCHEMPQVPLFKGYPRVTLRGTQFDVPFDKVKPLYLSHVSLVRAGQITLDRNADASHLCHNKLCVRAEHLRWESHEDNVKRTNCTGIVHCTCGCESRRVFCPHEPKCKVIKLLP